MTPGIYDNLSNEEYHAAPGISKTGLWTIYNKTLAHYRFEQREYKPAFDIGSAAHYALLQPELLDERVIAGPADRRGNKWIDAQNEAAHYGRLLLTAGDYATAMRMREAGARNATLRDVQRGALVEWSGFATDPDTGVLVRCRPDAYNPRLGLIADLKSATDASPRGFGKAVGEYGYHAQEAFYSDVWALAGAAAQTPNKRFVGDVSAFLFIVIEKKEPFCVACYELKPSAVEEGREAYRAALKLYAQSKEREELGMPPEHAWPGYEAGIAELDIPRWAYRITTPEQDQ